MCEHTRIPVKIICRKDRAESPDLSGKTENLWIQVVASVPASLPDRSESESRVPAGSVQATSSADPVLLIQ